MRAARILLVAGVLFVLLAAPMAAGAADSAPARLIVGFQPDTTGAQRQAALDAAGARPGRRLAGVRAVVVQAASGATIDGVRAALRRAEGVAYVERDAPIAVAKSPNDPFFGAQYGLFQASGRDIDAAAAWDTQDGCAPVAVLDTGIDAAHPDLQGNLWTNPGEVPANGADDDGNGYVDDVHGVDVRTGGQPDDLNGHGSHVSGIIAAVGNNGTGVTGVCWRGAVMAVKFMSVFGSGTTSDAVAGMEYAIRMGARVINASFGTRGRSEALRDAIRLAKRRGTLIVAAAGNERRNIDRVPVYPAAYPDGNVIAVAASDREDRLASFSNYGRRNVDLAAPGVRIASTIPGGRYAAVSGTSQAAPFVAGAAALLMQQNPGADYRLVRSRLREQVDRPGALRGKVHLGARLNLLRALQALPPPAA